MKNIIFRRADRVVRPYGAKSKTNTGSAENRHKTGASCGSMRRPQASFEAQPRSARLLAPRWASTPTLRNGKRGDFCPTHTVYPIPFVGAKWKPNAITPIRPYGGVFILEGGSMWALTPTLRNGKRGDFPRPSVGADAYIGPLKCCDFASDFHKSGQFRRADRVVRPYGVKNETLYNNTLPPLRGCFRFGGWVDVGIDPYGAKSKISTLSAAQTSAPPRMSMTFPSSVRRSVSQQVMSTCPERI